MARQAKLGTPQGVEEWVSLDTIGDAKRFIAWCIHSVRDQSMDTRTAATLGQLACYLMKAMETTELERRLEDLEKRVATPESHNESGSSTFTH
jgi:urease accessory protein UreF